MYFLLNDTPYGIIRVSCEGLYEFADEMLRPRLKLYSVTLLPSGNLTVVFSDDDLLPEDRKKIEMHFDAVLRPMGLHPAIVWAIPERGIMQIIGSPYLWAGVASSSAVIISAGFAGFFWTVFWGVSAWFFVRGMALMLKRLRRNERRV